MAAKKPLIRVLATKEELEKMTKEDLQKCWLRQDQYIDHIESKLSTSTEQSELQSLRESEEKLKQQQLEATRRENILVMRLTTKEQEMQEYVSQIQELKQAQIPSVAQLRSALLDPAVNLLFERMRKEMDALTARLQETQNELSAWKFTPDSNTGKRLMAKCRLLYQENEELGKMISSGRMAKLEGDLALQKSFSEEMKKSQSELDEFLLELDEDVEGMQSTIYYLQQQLREAKDQLVQHRSLPNGSASSITENPHLSPPKPPAEKESVEMNGSSSISFDRIDSRRPRTPPEKSPPYIKTEIQDEPEEESYVSVTEDVRLSKPPSTPKIEDVIQSNKPSSTSLEDAIRSNRTPLSTPEEDIILSNRPLLTSHEDVRSNRPHLTAHEDVRSNRPSSTARDANVPSVIVENVADTCDGSLPSVERTIGDGVAHPVDEQRMDNHDVKKSNLRGNERLVEVTPKSPPTNNTERSVSDSLRGRKRTRLQTNEVKEEPLPTRKRLRRRETIIPQPPAEEKRTALEIDTDTEVQVARTLASWASAKQERNEHDVSAVGNGEIKGRTNSGGK